MPVICRPAASPYSRVSRNIELPQAPPGPAEVLAKIANAANAGAALDDFSPPHEGYKKLKAMLAQMRGKAPGAKEIADGHLLKLKRQGPDGRPARSAAGEKLGLSGDASDLKYDAKVAEAVKKSPARQRAAGYRQPRAKTINELNGPPRDKQIDTVISQHGHAGAGIRAISASPMLTVNLPDFSLQVTAQRRAGLEHPNRDRENGYAHAAASARR